MLRSLQRFAAEKTDFDSARCGKAHALSIALKIGREQSGGERQYAAIVDPNLIATAIDGYPAEACQTEQILFFLTRPLTAVARCLDIDLAHASRDPRVDRRIDFQAIGLGKPDFHADRF